MDFALTQPELAAWVLIFARLLGWISIDPVIGRLPWFLRLFFAGVFAWVWVPGVSVTVDPLSWPGLMLLAGEYLFGAALGLVVRIFFAISEVALQTLGLTASLGQSQVVPEQQGGLEWPLRQLAFWLALLAFMSANGHGLVIQALSSGFASLPVAAMPSPDAAMRLAEAGGMVLASGLQLALPMLVLVLLAHFAFAFLSRMQPGVEGFSVGLTLGAISLLAALAMAIPLMVTGLGKVLERLPGLLSVLVP
ncbi:MAG: flagellar biosynthetic protein FliR [Hydrogenophilaceae bacterium]|nr:flagellar biosynthetic protein FliR [Hydrogenophilaceae bacterium]